ncbi:MAG TPA: efflux RND transporter periplasmic adaptor subunit [Bryobacterales bacterium]|nr:efflux RND transporter periplasmic adaptor subunit [Bryobacterales bacterium]
MKTRGTILILLVAAAAYVGGYGYGRWYGKGAAAPSTAAPPAGRHILYYVDPMHPAYRSDKPGFAPDCGMKLEPVYAVEGAGAMPGPGGALPRGTVQISPQKQQLIGVKYGTAEYTRGSRTIRTVGKVAYDETRIARVHTKIEGWIDRVFVNFTGDVVEKGRPLLTLYSPEMLASEQEFLLALRAKDVMQHSTMVDMPAYSDSLLAATRRRLELWDLSGPQIEEIARRRQPLKNITIDAPISGYVTARNAFPSQRIMPETELYTIVDLSTVWVMADVFEYEAPLVRIGQPATVTLSYYPGRTFRGRVSYLQPQVDPVTRTVKARIEMDNPANVLKPEMFADVELPIATPERLTVPAEAVLDSGQTKTVFVDRGDGYFEPRAVETGDWLDGQVEILKGLQVGERIVTSGNFLIDSESRLKTATSGMGAMPGMEHQH